MDLSGLDKDMFMTKVHLAINIAVYYYNSESVLIQF